MSKYSRIFFIAGVLSAAVCFSACEKSPDGDTETESTVSVTEAAADAAAVAETEAEETETEKTSPETEKETDITVSETEAEEQNQKEIYPSKYFEDNGYDFLSHLDMLRVDMDNFSDEVKPLTGLDSKYLDAVIGIEVHHAQDADLSFISECKNLKRLTLLEYSGDIHSLIELLEAYNIKNVSIRPVNYSSADAELLMKEFDGAVQYRMDSSQWLGADGFPTEGVVFYANLYVLPGSATEKWESQIYAAQSYYPKTWNYHGSLVSVFSNFTEERQTVRSVRIFRDDGEKLAEMPFADGSTSLEIDFVIDPNTNTGFDITEEMFPFSECETGIYKVVFDVGDEQLEQTFFIKNTVGMSFLTDEQKEIFEKTVDEWNERISYGRGGDISVQENCFVPLYSDDNEVLFKNIVIHGHEDYPYFIWFEELNYHMVKTDDGWDFDNFQLWY